MPSINTLATDGQVETRIYWRTELGYVRKKLKNCIRISAFLVKD